jgi:hypothetical protein
MPQLKSRMCTFVCRAMHLSWVKAAAAALAATRWQYVVKSVLVNRQQQQLQGADDMSRIIS